MKRAHPNNPDGCSGSIVVSTYKARGYPTAEDVDRAKVFRRLHEARTPGVKAKMAWRKSAEMRKAPITLATEPFDHRSDT